MKDYNFNKLYKWIVDRVEKGNYYFIDELKPFIKQNDSYIYRGFSDINIKNNDCINIKWKSFSKKYDVAYDFATMSNVQGSKYIISINPNKLYIIELHDIYKYLKLNINYDLTSLEMMLINEEEIISMNNDFIISHIEYKNGLTSNYYNLF